MFYTFQSALYIGLKPDMEQSLQLLKEVVEEVNSNNECNLIPFGRGNKKIVEQADSALLVKKGGIIVFKENKYIKRCGLKEININCYVISSYKNCTIIKFDPVISVDEKSVVQEVYQLMKRILLPAIDKFRPTLMQLNGLGEENQQSIVSPASWDMKSLPPFFTPLNYLQGSLVSNFDLDILPPVADVSSYADGYVIEFSEKKSESEISSLLRKFLKEKREFVFSRIMP